MKNHPVAPDRPDNLFEPVPGKAATHGIFDDQAKARSPQLWLSTHRAAVAGAGVAAMAAIGAAVGAARR
ncbi:MAG: SDR family oxidoreductase, partial [Solirubrobacteraceae bacterium]